MFDNIHFVAAPELTGAVPGSRPHVRTIGPDRQEEDDWNASILFAVNPVESSDFKLDWTLRFLPVFPVTEAFMKQYCWVQSFSVAESGPAYFTSRANAHSFLLMVTIGGSGILECGGKEFLLEEGDVFYIDCRKPHAYRTRGDRWEHIDLHMEGPMLEKLYAEYTAETSIVFRESLSGVFMDRIEAIAALLDRGAPLREYRMAGQLFDLAVYIMTRTVPSAGREHSVDESLRYLVRYIDLHYSEKLTLDSLSRFSGLSKYYLCREFRRYTGFSPNDYIIRQRINVARQLLGSTALPAAHIAERVGIPNVEHFSKQFRRVTGMSPREYRATAQ